VPFALCLKLVNHTSQLQELSVKVKDTGAFVLGGLRQGNVVVLPRSSKTLHMTLVPLVAGRLPIPHFHIISRRFDKEVRACTIERRPFMRVIAPAHLLLTRSPPPRVCSCQASSKSDSCL
jgi:hypothetical protein